MKDPVLIKSNKHGITVRLNPDMSYIDLLQEIKTRFEAAAHFFDHAAMAVEYTGRTLTQDEEQEITAVISGAAGIQILCIIEHDSLTEKIYRRAVDDSLEDNHDKDGQFYKGTLRSRQILESETSIIIIGDVEEGATVAARGNVIVIGTIYGTAIAGAAGNKDAFIAALHMKPSKLRIGNSEVKPNLGGSYSWAKLL